MAWTAYPSRAPGFTLACFGEVRVTHFLCCGFAYFLFGLCIVPHTVNGSGGDHVGHCVLICAFMFLVSCCNVRYDFRCSAPLYPSCLWEGSCLICVVCLFRIVAFYDNMCNMAGVFLEAWPAYPSRAYEFTPFVFVSLIFFCGIRISQLLIFCVIVFVFHHVFCVPNVASVSGLSILDYLFMFL